MGEEKKLKIVHCNIDSCADKSNADKLLTDVLKQNADITIFTEYTNTLRTDFENMLKEKYSLIYIDDSNYNGIAMFISSKFIAEEINIQWKKEELHPDILCVDIEGKSMKTRIAGVRFQILNADNVYEILNYFLFVHSYKPDIIIGDFNWFSVFRSRNYFLKAIELLNGNELDERYIELKRIVAKLNITIEKRGKLQRQYQPIDNLEQKLCDIINGLIDINNSNFSMWPNDKIEQWSYVTKGEGGKIVGVTSPDRIVYDTNNIAEFEADYYPFVDMKTNFPEEWAPDHAMMIATLMVK